MGIPRRRACEKRKLRKITEINTSPFRGYHCGRGDFAENDFIATDEEVQRRTDRVPNASTT